MINQRHKRLLKEKKKMRYDKMKHLKLKTGLSALAIAFAVAGAINLQTMAVANAEDNYDASGLTMANGAAVALREDFSGIRWETKINAAWYNNLPSGAKIGVIVLPTSMIGDDGELTYDDSTQILDLAYGEKSEGDNMAEDTVFYSVVNYENIINEYAGELSNEEALAKAYALELTARAYVSVDGEYQYADLSAINTSRSARQVAIAAELAGEIDKKYREVEENAYLAQKAEAYYGMSEKYTPAVKSTGAAGTAVIDMENPTATVTVAGWEIAGDFQEAVIGAEKVEATYADGTLTITEATGIPTGENYITVFTSAGVYTQPVIGATKVIMQASDLAIFNAKGGNGEYTAKTTKSSVDFVSKYWKAEQEQSGYYVLGQNIDATGYVHGSKYTEDAEEVIAGTKEVGAFNNATWNAADAYENKPIGLTGTFNGMGYTIEAITIGSQREGIFGIVNGGTVKNVAITNVKSSISYAYVVANYLLDATIENVYIDTNAYSSSDKANNPGFTVNGSGILASYAYGDTKIANSVFRYNAPNPSDKTGGALFGTDNKIASYTFENVFVYLRGKHKLYQEVVDGETTTYKSASSANYFPMLLAAQAKVTDGAITTKGTIYLAQNQVEDPNAETLVPNEALGISTNAYNVKIMQGVYAYLNTTDWKAAAHNYDALTNTGCWKLSSTLPVWKTA